MAEAEDVEPRAKRQKKDKFGRMAALDRLKQLKGKGTKNKYEVSDVDNVYETMDEREYSKTVSAKYEDWIVDDDGSGYVEDGRDVFDDDLDTESIAKASANKGKEKKKKKAVSENAGKGKLQYMLSNLPSKKQEEVKLDDDDILSELISEIDTSGTDKATIKPKTMSKFAEMKAARDYMSSFSSAKPKPLIIKVEAEKSIVEPETEDDITQDENTDVGNEQDIEETPVVAQEKPIGKKLLFHVEKPKVIEIIQPEEEISKDDAAITMDMFNDEFDDTQLGQIDTEHLLDDWENMQAKVENVEDAFDEEIDFDNVIIEDEEDIFRFFWWDAYEDPLVQPGVVFLFGKTLCKETKTYVSCSVVVRNIQRKLFILPRTNRLSNDEPVAILDVYQEFKDTVATDYKIEEFKSKKVEKKYAFDASVPVESEYLEVRYSAKLNRLPTTLTGDTFSHLFGTETSYLELLLLDCRIRGPCWLQVSSTTRATNPVTHCAVEMQCDRLTNLQVMVADGSSRLPPPPPLVVAAITVKPATNEKGGTEVAMISVLVQKKYQVERKAPSPPFTEHFCVVCVPSNTTAASDLYTSLQSFRGTRIQKLNSEKALLNYFTAQFARIDPDLIVGHDLTGYQLTILCDRLRTLDTTNYSRFSRIRRANHPSKSKPTTSELARLERILTTGRLVCDIKLSARELIKCRSYDLDTLCQNVLKIGEGQRIEIEAGDVGKMFASAGDLLKMVSLTMQDTGYVLKVMYELNVVPLALQITNIAGNVMSRTLLGGRAERNEFLLLHAFSEKDYIVPDKKYGRRTKVEGDGTTAPSRKKPQYSGGLVLDPKVGFYNNLVLLMDFNSLYPSIIQEFNICFTTMATNNSTPSTDSTTTIATPPDHHLPDSSSPPGILPTEIRKLVESRRAVKHLLKNPDLSADLAMQYHIRQMALKLTANSMYGCLGFAHSRFYARNLAELITQKGREILVRTKELAEKLGYDVIYGDTDSIMIRTDVVDYEQVMKIGGKIKVEVNRLYKQVELDIDGVFKYLLLLKKKKYAALVLSKDKNGVIKTTQEHKGLDIVRRDCAQIAVEAGRFVLNHILSESVQTAEELTDNIHTHLRQLAEDTLTGKVPLSLLVITKQLTKNPSLYANATSLPHVTVAKRYNSKAGRKFNAGDTVSYLICTDGTDLPPTQRAYSIEEFKKSESLKIDTKYYLAQQIHPVVSRLCDPIDGTGSDQLADCLGLDHSAVKRQGKASGGGGGAGGQDVGVNFKDPAVKYRGAKPLELKCPDCKHPNPISSPLTNNTLSLLNPCSNPDCSSSSTTSLLSPHSSHLLENQLQVAIAACTRHYYRGELMCEDPLCTQTTCAVPVTYAQRLPVCVFCHEGVMMRIYTARDLYKQLRFYEYLFDVGQLATKPIVEKQVEIGYERLKRVVSEVLNKSAYSIINLAYIARIVRKPQSLPQIKQEVDTDDLIDIIQDEDDYDSETDY